MKLKSLMILLLIASLTSCSKTNNNYSSDNSSNEISENKPSGDYETISYYRYVETSRDVIWSTEEAVEGYTKTGNTKLS